MRFAVLSLLLACTLGVRAQGTLHGNATIPQCLQSIEAAQLRLQAVPAGWRQGGEFDAPLTGISLMAGDPAQLGHLKPHAERRVGKGGFAMEWRFAAGPAPGGLWLSCEYAGGVVTLAAALPPVKRCRASTRPTRAPGAQIAMTLSCE